MELACTIDRIQEATGETIDPYQFPLDDKETYELLCCGDTKGVRVEGDIMREWLVRLKPDRFQDLIAMNALYRPGAIDNFPQYIAVKHGKEKPEYAHPVLEDVLSETYGVIVYQEQTMRILNRLGNIPLGDAYSCIKEISKKRAVKIKKYRETFIEGTRENGLAEEEADEIFELIIKFAPYGFNKSHATAYAHLTYMMAYLKAHFPVAFTFAQSLDSRFPIPGR
ncbi:hypothetical protein FACS189443_3970 [Planctomycetales bacterium]|nr:hypothetical protein FACS189443_3970 [Planctomycetales bacterium]